MSTHPTRRTGFTSPPKRLPQQWELLQRILEGMAKHKGDKDYPAVLDTLGIDSARDNVWAKLSQAKVMKAEVKRATGEANAEQALTFVFLEQIQSKLIGAYGKKSPTLYDYGFAVAKVHGGRKKSAAAPKKGKGTPGAATAGSPGGATPSPEPSTTPPSATPKA